MKYKLTDETLHLTYLTKDCKKVDCILYRIQNINTGELGGFIESENNLSQFDTCWVHDEARVYGESIISENAQIYGNSNICGSIIKNNAIIYQNSIINNSIIGDYVVISGNASVSTSVISNYCRIYDNAVINNCMISDYVEIFDSASLKECNIYNYSKLYGNIKLANFKLKDYIELWTNEVINKYTNKLESINEVLTSNESSGYDYIAENSTFFEDEFKNYISNGFEFNDVYSTYLPLTLINDINKIIPKELSIKEAIDVLDNKIYILNLKEFEEPIAYIEPISSASFDFYIDFIIDNNEHYHKLLAGSKYQNSIDKCIQEAVRTSKAFLMT